MRLWESPLEHPTRRNIAAVAPHLPMALVDQMLHTALKTRVNFIGPPVMVHGALHVFELDGIWENGVVRCIALRYLHAIRRSVSYQDSFVMRELATEHPAYEHQEEAETYACMEWPESLCWDRAKSVMAGHVIMPTDTELRTPATFIAWLNCEFPEVLYSGFEPPGELINDALMAYAWFGPAASEMLGGHASQAAYYCGICGGGLGQLKCEACGTTYTAARMRPPWSCAMPRAVQTPSFLNMDRVIGWLHDYDVWLKERQLEQGRTSKTVHKTRRIIEL